MYMYTCTVDEISRFFRVLHAEFLKEDTMYGSYVSNYTCYLLRSKEASVMHRVDDM